MQQYRDNSNNETGFRIERSVDGGTTFSLLTTTGADVCQYTDSSLSPTDLAPGVTQYVYRVASVNSVGDSGYSGTKAVSVAPLAPGTPQARIADDLSGVELAWQDNGTADNRETGFVVERSDDGGTTYNPIGMNGSDTTVGANVTYYEDTTADVETVYYYRICAVNAACNVFATGAQSDDQFAGLVADHEAAPPNPPAASQPSQNPVAQLQVTKPTCAVDQQPKQIRYIHIPSQHGNQLPANYNDPQQIVAQQLTPAGTIAWAASLLDFAVPDGIGNLLFTTTVATKDATIIADLQWQIIENPNEPQVLLTGNLTQTGQNPNGTVLQYSVPTTVAGSFYIVFYYDPNRGQLTQSDVILAWEYFAEVQVRVIPPTSAAPLATTNGASPTIAEIGASLVLAGSNVAAQESAITDNATMQLIGGGSDGMIGVSGIHTGWIGNVTSCDLQVSYPGGQVEYMATNAGAAPETYLDTAAAKDAFRNLSTQTTLTTTDQLIQQAGGVAGGQFVKTNAIDAPHDLKFSSYWDNQNVNNPKNHATNLTGSLKFTESLAAHSNFFTESYAVSAQAAWTMKCGFTWTIGKNPRTGTWTPARSGNYDAVLSSQVLQTATAPGGAPKAVKTDLRFTFANAERTFRSPPNPRPPAPN